MKPVRMPTKLATLPTFSPKNILKISARGEVDFPVLAKPKIAITATAREQYARIVNAPEIIIAIIIILTGLTPA